VPRRKKELLKADLEDLVTRLERSIANQIEQVGYLAAQVPAGKAAYYLGQRATLVGLQDFITSARAEYLKG